MIVFMLMMQVLVLLGEEQEEDLAER